MPPGFLLAALAATRFAAAEGAGGLNLGAALRVVRCADLGPAAGLRTNAPTVVRSVNGVRYREAGSKKGDRFGFELEFPRALQQGPPVMVEIVWPDDKPRSMGLYMYPEADRRQHRDRLEGGIQSGEEYPLSGAIRTTRYLFYPDRRRYLFEARTMIAGMPAAVVSVMVRPLRGPLPRLKVDYPEDEPHRRLGHLDEDQSFEVLFRKESGSDRAVRYLDRLCDYFDYTGQELLSYPLLRYHAVSFPTWGPYPGGGLRPEGWIDLFLQVLEARDKQLLGAVDLYTLPELYLRPGRLDEFIAAGMFTRDAHGDLVTGPCGYLPNPVHPAVRKAFLHHVDELLHRYGRRRAFGGLDLWRTAVWSFTSLNHGYDDATVGRFEAETGIKVPGGNSRSRFRTRYEFLTGSKAKAWLRWRARKTTELLAGIDRSARAARADMTVFVRLDVRPWETAGAPTLAAHYYRDFGIDVDALRKLPSVVLTPQRHPTGSRHQRHWDNTDSREDEVLYDPKNTVLFRAPGRATSAGFLGYFESFTDSLLPKVYKSYFQNADVKPHGRFFLKEWAFCLATMDTTRMLIGGQPLGTAGREEVVREFARNYCALPAVRFEDVAGSPDPVTVRWCATPEGTYLYAVNTLCFPCRTVCYFPRDCKGRELATGAAVRTAGKRWIIDLAPFQLRSFRFAASAARPTRVETSVSERTKEWFARRLARVETDVKAVAATGAGMTALEEHVAALRRAYAGGAYAEAHRLLFAKRIRALGKLREAAAEGYLAEQRRMRAHSRYAVNCGQGGSAFYRAKCGTLFFPDQPFQPGGYGHVGSYRSVTRSVRKVTGTEDPLLFTTEAYDLDGYRFTVKPGVYTVRLYLKVGYRPNANPGVFVVNVDLEGNRVLNNADLFLLMNRDFHRALVREFPGIRVSDGVLDVDFGVPAGTDPTARLCNAIEVIPDG